MVLNRIKAMRKRIQIAAKIKQNKETGGVQLLLKHHLGQRYLLRMLLQSKRMPVSNPQPIYLPVG